MLTEAERQVALRAFRTEPGIILFWLEQTLTTEQVAAFLALLFPAPTNKEKISAYEQAISVLTPIKDEKNIQELQKEIDKLKAEKTEATPLTDDAPRTFPNA